VGALETLGCASEIAVGRIVSNDKPPRACDLHRHRGR